MCVLFFAFFFWSYKRYLFWFYKHHQLSFIMYQSHDQLKKVSVASSFLHLLPENPNVSLYVFYIYI